MILIADISVPANVFALGQTLTDFPDVEIELERIVSGSEDVVSLFWVDSQGRQESEDRITSALREDPLTESVRRLTRTGDRTLYEVYWGSDIDGILRTLIDTDTELLEAEGTAEVWDFRLQFRSRDELASFRQNCRSKDISVTLRRLYNPSVPEDDSRLTDNQYEALVTAYEQGYFEVPRATSMDELATEFGISDSAFSQRIRRGSSTLISETLLPGE